MAYFREKRKRALLELPNQIELPEQQEHFGPILNREIVSSVSYALLGVGALVGFELVADTIVQLLRFGWRSTVNWRWDWGEAIESLWERYVEKLEKQVGRMERKHWVMKPPKIDYSQLEFEKYDGPEEEEEEEESGKEGVEKVKVEEEEEEEVVEEVVRKTRLEGDMGEIETEEPMPKLVGLSGEEEEEEIEKLGEKSSSRSNVEVEVDHGEGESGMPIKRMSRREFVRRVYNKLREHWPLPPMERLKEKYEEQMKKRMEEEEKEKAREQQLLASTSQSTPTEEGQEYPNYFADDEDAIPDDVFPTWDIVLKNAKRAWREMDLISIVAWHGLICTHAISHLVMRRVIPWYLMGRHGELSAAELATRFHRWMTCSLKNVLIRFDASRFSSMPVHRLDPMQAAAIVRFHTQDDLWTDLPNYGFYHTMFDWLLDSPELAYAEEAFFEAFYDRVLLNISDAALSAITLFFYPRAQDLKYFLKSLGLHGILAFVEGIGAASVAAAVSHFLLGTPELMSTWGVKWLLYKLGGWIGRLGFEWIVRVFEMKLKNEPVGPVRLVIPPKSREDVRLLRQRYPEPYFWWNRWFFRNAKRKKKRWVPRDEIIEEEAKRAYFF